MGETFHTDFDDADLTRTCTRKNGYPSQAFAKLAIASIHQRNPVASLRAYACRRCGLWHVGGVPRRDTRFSAVLDPAALEEDLDRRRGRFRRSKRRVYGDVSVRGARAPRRRRDLDDE